jgi:hypothetical protein
MQDWMKRLMMLLVFLAAGLTAFAQTETWNRGFYFDIGIGIGYGGIIYSGESGTQVKDLRDDDFYWVTLAVAVSLGWAVMEKLYVTGSFTGYYDRFSKAIDYKQFDTSLYGLGIKLYPLSSGQYLQLGADLGVANARLETSINSSIHTVKSGPGFGMKISAAYDIDPTMIGPSLLFGGDGLFCFIEGETRICFALFVRFLFK